MARVKSYVNDTSLSNDDRLFGTDGAGGVNSTANFSLGDLKEFVKTGVDIVAKTPKFHVPVINEESTDATAAGIRVELDEAANSVYYYVVDPDPTDENINKQIAVATFRLINDGTGWFLETQDYKGEFHLDSFVGKTFEALAGPGLGTTVTGVLGAYEEFDEKDYFVNEDGEVFHRLAVTRTGDLETTWAELTSARSTVTQLFFLSDENDSLPNRISIFLDGNLTTLNITAEDLFVNDIEADALQLREGGDGIVFGDPDTDVNYFTLGADADGNLIFEGNGTAELFVNAPVNLNDTLDVAELATFASDVIVEGNQTVNGTAEFNDTTAFNADSTFTDATINLVSSDEADDNAISITNDGITQTINNPDDADNPFIFPIESVDGNSLEGATLQGALTRVRVGDEYWNVPASVSQTAQILPGLSEELSPVPNGEAPDSVRLHNAGRSTGVTITTIGTSFATLVADIGRFGIFSAIGMTLDEATDTITTSNADRTPDTSAAEINSSDYVILIDDGSLHAVEYGKVAVGDDIVIYDADSITRFVSAEVTSTSGDVATIGGVTYSIYLFGINTPVRTGGNWAITDDSEHAVEVINNASAGDITTGTWFTGIDRGLYAEYTSTLTDLSTALAGVNALSLTAGSTFKVIPQVDTLRDAFNDVDSQMRLFFVDNTTVIPTLAMGDVVPGNAYEVVDYIHDDGQDPVMAELSFSLLGDGNLVISTPDISFTNIRESDGVIDRFVVLNDDSTVTYRELGDVAGFASQVTYQSLVNDDNGVVTNIDFISGSQSNHNIDSGAGAIEVDVSGRIPVSQVILTTAIAARLNAWESYVLYRPDEDPDEATRTLTLPDITLDNVEIGDEVVFYNLSNVDNEGADQSVLPDQIWHIATLGDVRIMRDTVDLELDTFDNITLIWSGIDEIGWLIK